MPFVLYFVSPRSTPKLHLIPVVFHGFRDFGPWPIAIVCARMFRIDRQRYSSRIMCFPSYRCKSPCQSFSSRGSACL